MTVLAFKSRSPAARKPVVVKFALERQRQLRFTTADTERTEDAQRVDLITLCPLCVLCVSVVNASFILTQVHIEPLSENRLILRVAALSCKIKI
jgi:hypothetical protein